MCRILAVIPARGGSKRVPRKNILPFHGRPLLHWTVGFARETGLFETVAISSDDAEIISCGQEAGARSFGLRPAALSHDTATSVDVALHELDRAEAEAAPYDYLALLQPTTPFRLATRWQAAMALLDTHPTVPSVIGVAPPPIPPYHMFTLAAEGVVIPLFPDHLTRRTQDLPETVAINGALYLVRCDALRSARGFVLPDTRAVLCDDPRENVDIDTPADFEMALSILGDTLADGANRT